MREYILGFDRAWWHFYLKPHVGLCYRKKDGLKFGDFEVLEKNAESDFCVIALGDYIHLVCQDRAGALVYFRFNGERWTREILLESRSARPYPKHFQMLEVSEHIILLYVITHKEKHMLVHQVLSSTTPVVVDYINPKTPPYSAGLHDSTDFSVFYENENGQSGEKVFRWSQKAYFDFRSSVPAGTFIKFARMSGGASDYTAIQTIDKISNLVYIKREPSGMSGEPVIVYLDCADDIRPILSEYNEKMYMVWEESGHIMSSYSQNKGESWSKPIKYARSSTYPTTLFSVCQDGKYEYFYGVSREYDITLYGTHDILKKTPEAKQVREYIPGEEVAQFARDAGAIENEAADKTTESESTMQTIYEYGRRLKSMKTELDEQKKIIASLAEKIEKMTPNVPIAENEDVIDDILMR